LTLSHRCDRSLLDCGVDLVSAAAGVDRDDVRAVELLHKSEDGQDLRVSLASLKSSGRRITSLPRGLSAEQLSLKAYWGRATANESNGEPGERAEV
jgi:hypothetical protein